MRTDTVTADEADRRVVVIGPADPGNGDAVKALLAANTVDAGLAADVRAARDAVSPAGPACPT